MKTNRLEDLSPEAFLNPDNLVSLMDGWSDGDYAKQQYAKGLDLGTRAKTVHIAVNNVWSADMKDGSNMFSYEKIGYHGCTRHLLHGFLDSGVRIVVHRNGLKEGVVIK